MAHPDYAQFRPPPEPLDKPVFIDLAQLYGAPRPDPPPPRGGSIRDRMRLNLDLNRQVPGMLRWWVRSVDGRWLGLCDFTIPDIGGATVIRQEGAAVPADALEPRPEEPFR